jgi:hypothetical protein
MAQKLQENSTENQLGNAALILPLQLYQHSTMLVLLAKQGLCAGGRTPGLCWRDAGQPPWGHPLCVRHPRLHAYSSCCMQAQGIPWKLRSPYMLIYTHRAAGTVQTAGSATKRYIHHS